MKAIPSKSQSIKKSAKQDRERQVLISLIELYLKSGKPIGSNTLKEMHFGELSSATIRNYFADLEKEGYLSQQHSSGGRIPTSLAFRLYAHEYENEHYISEIDHSQLKELRLKETHELAAYLEQAAELLSHLTQCAAFLSSPRFEHDYINDIKLVGIDSARSLCVMITNFGAIHTEVIHHEKKLSSFSLKRMEAYFQWRLNRTATPYESEKEESHLETKTVHQPENLTEDELHLAQQFYHEMMMRFIVNYTHFNTEDIYRTGFSKLLSYPELQETTTLTNCLSFFENVHSIRSLLKACRLKERLLFWIGEDLQAFSQEAPEISVLAIPYYINKQCVGALGLLGPMRMPYRQLFGLLHHFSESISESLTRNIFKFKITYRQPQRESLSSQGNQPTYLGYSRLMLLEHNLK